MYQQYRQCQELIKFLEGIKYSEVLKDGIIMMGDFNAMPYTPPIKILQEKFVSLMEKDNTFPSIFPTLKLDYIWISKNLEKELKNEVRVINNGLSDHISLSLN